MEALKLKSLPVLFQEINKNKPADVFTLPPPNQVGLFRDYTERDSSIEAHIVCLRLLTPTLLSVRTVINLSGSLAYSTYLLSIYKVGSILI